MEKARTPTRQRSFPAVRKPPLFYTLATLALMTAGLFWAQKVLIPLALAILLAFLLTPLVSALQRWRLGRAPAVLTVVVLAFGLLGGIGWAVVGQLVGLTHELSSYEDNIKHKIVDLRGAGKGTFIEKAQNAAEEVMKEIHKQAPADKETPKPVPVVVEGPSVFWQLPSLIEELATAGLVMVLVIFMLLQRGDVRNRLIRLVGLSRLTTTTRALDEAGQRISRYLLMQSIINSLFGIVVGTGLFILGLPHALLWGFLAAVLRFIPYVGVTLAILLPSLLSLAVFPGWTKPLLVIGFITPIEFLNSMFLEPYLYGQSSGVSEIALLIAIAFWTWLWGPVGLLLATPLTVSMVVLGKYVPQLEFFVILMGDEPVMDTDTSYYQRLVARDQDEAEQIVSNYVHTHTPAELYEAVLLPALSTAKKDRLHDNLSEADIDFIVQTTRDIVDDQALSVAAPDQLDTDLSAASPPLKLLAFPVHDDTDEVALMMLVHLLDPARYTVEILPETILASELVAQVEQTGVDLVCLGSVAPGGMIQIRYLCKRLRAQFPSLKIIVGRWGTTGERHDSRDLLRSLEADYLGMSLDETCQQIMEMSPILSSRHAQVLPPVYTQTLPPVSG